MKALLTPSMLIAMLALSFVFSGCAGSGNISNSNELDLIHFNDGETVLAHVNFIEPTSVVYIPRRGNYHHRFNRKDVARVDFASGISIALNSSNRLFEENAIFEVTQSDAELKVDLESFKARNLEYPPHFVGEERQRGTVHLNYVVDTDGTVAAVEVVYSTNRLLNRFASDFAKKLTYEPATYNEQPVRTLRFRTLEF